MRRHSILKTLPTMLLVFVLVISLMSVTAFAASDLTIDVDGQSVTLKDTDDDDFYEIGTADELYAFSVAVCQRQYRNLNAELTADITVNENVLDAEGNLNTGSFREWKPIESDYDPYGGIFDGHGFTISGLYFDDSSSYGCGLVANLGEGGCVQNVNIADSYFKSGHKASSIVAEVEGGSVKNCTSSATVISKENAGGLIGIAKNSEIFECGFTGIATGTGTYHAAGVVAETWGGSVKYCYNHGTVSGAHYVGGVVGHTYENTAVVGCYNEGAISSSGIGVAGIVGYSQGPISDCRNKGNITSGYMCAGGIAGSTGEPVENCFNDGNISGCEEVGGVFGANCSPAKNCYNTGKVSGDDYVGGVVGANYDKMESCYSVGAVTGKGRNVGGFEGFNVSSSAATNCYYNTDVYSGDGSGNPNSNNDITGKTTAQFASGEVCWLLNGGVTDGTQAWYQVCGVGIPTFSGDTVYRTETDDGYFYYNQGLASATETEITYANMTLGNSLAMNFAFPQEDVEDWSGAYVKIVKEYADARPDKEVTIPFEDWDQANISGVMHYTVKYEGVAAKEMSDPVYVTIYDADGYAISGTWEDSVRGYAMRTLNNPKTSKNSATMVVDLLNYGAAAQQYFGYNTFDLANSEMTAEQKALATQNAPATDSRVMGANYQKSNLGLESQILMRMAFTQAPEDAYATIEFTNHSGTKVKVDVKSEEIQKSGSYSVIVIDEIVIADGRKPVTVTIYNADGSVFATGTDSMESYIARMRETKEDPLFEAILKFSDSAYNFFHN